MGKVAIETTAEGASPWFEQWLQNRAQTLVYGAEPSWVEGFHPIFPDRPIVYVESAEPGDVRTFSWLQIPDARSATIGEPLPGLDAFNEKHEHDRIWDLLVLAAESSRYGDT